MSAKPIPENPVLAGVIGWPVAHSLSPLIHGTWAAREGINGQYIPIPVAPEFEAFVRTMDELKAQGYAGVNITIPHKENALRYADEASDGAARAGAANMLTFSEGKSRADNSDIEGFAASLAETNAKPGPAIVLGAGGAARGVLLALEGLGFGPITILNRTRSRAEETAKTVENHVVKDWNERNAALRGAKLLVNTTSLGMSGHPPLEIDLFALDPAAVVADIVYTPLETPLLKAAKARGCKTADGLSMLMHQAVPGFKAWFGGNPKVDEDLRSLLVSELNKRERA